MVFNALACRPNIEDLVAEGADRAVQAPFALRFSPAGNAAFQYRPPPWGRLTRHGSRS